jgi:hypothetical protein
MHAKRQSSSETTHVIQATVGHLTVKVFFALSRGRSGARGQKYIDHLAEDPRSERGANSKMVAIADSLDTEVSLHSILERRQS